MDWTANLLDPLYDLECCGKPTIGGMVEMTVIPERTQSVSDVLDRVAARAAADELAIVRVDALGPMAAHVAEVPSGCGWSVPVLWYDGEACCDRAMSGVQAYGVPRAGVAPVEYQGRPVGCQWETDAARFVQLNDFRATDASATQADQTRQVLDRYGEVLAALGLSFRDVVRTWYYLDHLLDWYDVFNRVRTTFYREQGMGDGVMPASTGIGAPVGGGSALSVSAFAVVPKSSQVTAQRVLSPLQCSATDYGSSFSRAIEVTDGTATWLSVSGTASIAPEGESLYQDDALAQVRQTMAVVEAILLSRCADWSYVTRATAYFKHIADAPTLATWCDEVGAPEMPIIICHADVCRDELLYEIELDAQW